MLVLCLFYISTRLSLFIFFFFFSSRRRHTRCSRDWSSDVCSSDLRLPATKRKPYAMLSSRWFLGLLTVVIVGGFLAWQGPRWSGQPAVEEAAAQPHPGAARGGPAADEKATIALVERSKGSGGYISTIARGL